MRSPAALWAWLLLVPACGLFFHADSRVLQGWRRTLLDAWVTLDLDFEVLRGALLANPALPKGTLEGMLATLPAAGNLVAEQKVLAPTRSAVAVLNLAVYCDRAEALLLKTVASAIVVGAVLAAIWMRAWMPLVALTTIGFLPPAHAWRAYARRQRVDKDVASYRAQPGFSDADYRRMEAGLK